MGVSHNAGGLADGADGEYILQTAEKGADDPLSCSHNPLESSAARDLTVTVPDGNTAGQDALNDAPVQCFEDGCGKVHL